MAAGVSVCVMGYMMDATPPLLSPLHLLPVIIVQQFIRVLININLLLLFNCSAGILLGCHEQATWPK